MDKNRKVHQFKNPVLNWIEFRLPIISYLKKNMVIIQCLKIVIIFGVLVH